ncbi:hypothetical protein [Candidatus Methylacidithermus pantelleriae]|uniref:Outer membrane protein or related peptidoglycan-associated (Lipo)protein n=1 Tax=Candidatus Methylacidithermus pantelleriae TaxID=2744239 RepID=A0A8J2BLE4_9BACT|nr:hypothetical protein [Candidatus Methylacidithermus pantelleriae]CAF0704948.1 Outer membrane protein or related peptidoglycan-associated (Lipo)protein [Candidatus Methylacidithermus pantelleriae]
MRSKSFPQIHRIRIGFLSAFVSIFSFGCATQPYSQYDSTTRQFVDNLERYGSIAGAGAAGFFAGKEIGKSDTAGAVGAIVGTAAMYGVHKFSDRKRMDAYLQGKAEGKADAIAEILNDKWTREAKYGLPPEGHTPSMPKYRSTYVPSRKDPATGVEYPGTYQTIPVYSH